MRRLAVISLLLWSLGGWSPVLTRAQTQSDSPRAAGVTFKWLGTAGWEIRVADRTILIDPFLTRKEPDRTGGEWVTDAAAVLKVIGKADFIFAGHSHADHIGDIPFIAKKFGAKVVGSTTTTNIALTAGVDKSQLVTVRGGETLEFDGFTVQVIESLHGVRAAGSGRRRGGSTEEISRAWSGPIKGTDFVEGGSYLYCFTIGKLRVLHQSTANFNEAKLAGLKPDVALLAEGHRGYNLEQALRILDPKTVVVHHFDNWRVPFAAGIQGTNIRRAERFARDIRAANSSIKVIIPDFLTLFSLD